MRNREVVLLELKSAVSQERSCTLKVLHLLREIEKDQHYLSLGYPSLFEFAVKELGYSSGATFRRIQSMRLLKTMPEIEPEIERGALSLCAASQAQTFFRKEDQKRKTQGQEKMTLEFKQKVVSSLLEKSSRECGRVLAEFSPESALPPEKTRALSETQTLIQFIADSELMEKLEKLKNLLAHQNFEGSYDRLFHILADLALKKLDPEPRTPKRERSQLPLQAHPSPAQIKRTPLPALEKSAHPTRYIPAAIKRHVWIRNQGQCTYRDPQTGRRCSSQHALEYDHVIPWARGGANTEENLTLKCRAHNAWKALQDYGPKKMSLHLL